MKTYAKLTLTIIAGWFLFALTASFLNVFRNATNQVGIAVGLAAIVPIAVFGLWYAVSDAFRQFVLSLNPQVLTLAQVWRLVGFIFVLLQARDVLPAVFALPAGYGDMLIGATATAAAWKLVRPVGVTPWRRAAFILWQSLGITDLVLAVSLGTTARLISPSGPSMVAMTVLPLSLVPTFFVPLFLILHLICIAQARRWPEQIELPTGIAQQARA